MFISCIAIAVGTYLGALTGKMALAQSEGGGDTTQPAKEKIVGTCCGTVPRCGTECQKWLADDKVTQIGWKQLVFVQDAPGCNDSTDAVHDTGKSCVPDFTIKGPNYCDYQFWDNTNTPGCKGPPAITEHLFQHPCPQPETDCGPAKV